MSWALGNTDFGGGTGSANSIVSAGYSSVAGNLIVVAVAHNQVGTTALITPSDTLGNTYYQIAHVVSGGTLDVWVCFSSVGSGSNTVTASLSGSASNRAIAVVEFSGGEAIPLQDVFSGSVVSASITSAAHFCLSAAGLELFAATVSNAPGGTWTAGSGFAIAVQDANAILAIQYQIYAGVQTLGITSGMSHSSGNQKKYVVSIYSEDQGGGTVTAGGYAF